MMMMSEKKMKRLQVVKDGSLHLSWVILFVFVLSEPVLCVLVFSMKNTTHTVAHHHLLVVSLLLQLFVVLAAHTDLMSLIHRLLPVVQLFIQVTFLFTEQILENNTQRSEVIEALEGSAAGSQTNNLLFPDNGSKLMWNRKYDFKWLRCCCCLKLTTSTQPWKTSPSFFYLRGHMTVCCCEIFMDHSNSSGTFDSLIWLKK